MKLKLIMQNKIGSTFEQVFEDTKLLYEKKTQLEQSGFKLIAYEKVPDVTFPNLEENNFKWN